MSVPARLVLGHPEYTELLTHAVREYPREAVGLLAGGEDGVVREVTPLRNVAGGRSFLADPLQQFKALRAFRDGGFEAVAVYHSHPDGGVTLSALDLLFARQLELLQVVVAVHPGKVPPTRIRAFRVAADGSPHLIDLTIPDEREAK